MSFCIFVGPTLRQEEIRRICDADCRPPASQGDVYQASRRRVTAIGIIDGFFSGSPSVWHKEILWALSQGIPVFGSASMGALRAAELHRFGVRGVGRIFEAFRDGTLEDDDEVAVVHGPAELGFLPVSEPMVNIRATLARAEADGVLSAAGRRSLESVGKSLFYPHRSWPALAERAPAGGVGDAELEALLRWLPQGRVDQKREDALAMLAAMQETTARPATPIVDWRFEWTHFWSEMVEPLARDAGARDDSGIERQRGILEELRLEGGGLYGRIRSGALLRLLAERVDRAREPEAGPQAILAALSALRQARELLTRSDLDSWLARNGLDEKSLERLLRSQVRLEEIARSSAPALERYLLDELRLSGDYERLAARAERKHRALLPRGPADLGIPAQGPSAFELRVWHFSQRLRQPMPDDMKLFARELGFEKLADFDSALFREWIYFRAITQKSLGKTTEAPREKL